jgi:hypothetical protein
MNPLIARATHPLGRFAEYLHAMEDGLLRELLADLAELADIEDEVIEERRVGA